MYSQSTSNKGAILKVSQPTNPEGGQVAVSTGGGSGKPRIGLTHVVNYLRPV
jgi:hypothetical protein